MERFSYANWAPDAPLDRFVRRFWKTAWDLPAPFVQTIVTHPAVNLVVQADGSVTVSGIHCANDERRLAGTGWALGVLFRAGGFRPFVEVAMAELSGSRLPAAELFGPEAVELGETVAAATDDARRLAAVSAFLARRAPAQPTVGEQLSALVEQAAEARPPVTSVAALAQRHGVSVRTLQRLFVEHVGVGPKWVLDRGRLHAAAESAIAPSGPVTSWADVAQRLGYADQAHLTAAFSSTFGTPPATYARLENGGATST